MKLVTVDPQNPVPVPVLMTPIPMVSPDPQFRPNRRKSKAVDVRYMQFARVSGIPCYVDVTHCHIQKPLGRYADSDMDCYGYEEVEFDLYDRKGYRAVWLEKKMTDEDRDEIVNQIVANYSDSYDGD